MRIADRQWLPVVVALVLMPEPALAHSFGRVYNLPVPFWLYAWAAAAALVASFLVAGYFVTQSSVGHSGHRLDLSQSRYLQWGQRWRLLWALRLLSVSGLLLCVLTGLLGTQSPYGNFNMTFFWIVFVLGFAYLTALAGDVYAVINPWRVLAEGIDRVFRGYATGRFRYPARMGYWPALLFYMTFIWIELFGGTGPHSLALILLAYSLINFVGVGLVGMRDWFRYCEFFSVFMRLIARMAPIDYLPAGDGRPRAHLCLRRPFQGLAEPPIESMSLLVFILFMLSSTAFDGLRETLFWQRLFWLDLYRAGLQDWLGHNPLAAFPAMRQLYYYWQGFWLLATPFLYLLVYGLFIWLMRIITRSDRSLRELCLQFALTLLPIALVYNITHYYTLIQTQGVKIISLASDPFGLGWDLFGTAGWLQYTIIPDAGTVWHVQVGLIVLGHVISVYLAHQVALRVFPSHRQAVLSQLPMLVLMVIFTTAGLWILSQPLK